MTDPFIRARGVDIAEVAIGGLFILCAGRGVTTGLVRDALGLELPDRPNTFTGRQAFWLAPRRWLLVGASVADRTSQTATAGCHVADVTDGYAVFKLRGAQARELLAQGCSLDLHPRVFGPERCARTLLARVPILLHRDGAGWRLFADSAYRAYLRQWFAAVAATFPEAVILPE